MMSDHSPPTSGSMRGFSLIGLLVGLAAGATAYGITEFWIDDRDDAPLAITTLFFVITVAASYLLLSERDRVVQSIPFAIGIAAILVIPDYFLASAMGDETANLSSFPALFWFGLTRTLTTYLMLTLVKSALSSGLPPNYQHVFFHGTTLPLIAAGAKVFAGLALVLLFAWARLLKELDVQFFNKIFQEPWFLLPFLGAIGGLSIALMRGQQAVLGALRSILLLLARLLIVITAIFTVTLLIVFATKGIDVAFERPYPGAWMMGLALLGMLIFNGVYQNGETGPPPLWLRLPTIVTLIGFPIYTAIAFYAFWLRVGEYGLTPPRIAGLTINGLIAAYSIVCIAGLLTEANWRGRKWMPLVPQLNILMAAAWIAALVIIASPVINPWAVSARSQFGLIKNEKMPAAEFDYGYLRFELGKYGEAALENLTALTEHPEYDAIVEGVARARAANNYWEYQNQSNDRSLLPTPADPAVEETENEVLELEFNPDVSDEDETSGD